MDGARYSCPGLSGLSRSCADAIICKPLRVLQRRIESTGCTSGRPDSGDKVSDGYTELYVLRGSSKRTRHQPRNAPGRFHGQLRREPISSRRDSGVRRSRIRDLRPATCMSEGSVRPDEINRYRQRIGIAHPLPVNGRIWKPFATYETFYERSNGGWNRERVIGLASRCHSAKHVLSALLHVGETSSKDYGTSTTCCLA